MSWKSIADLLGAEGEVSLLGAPLGEGSVTPGRCDLAPETVRRALRRVSTYDIDTGHELDMPIQDRGDVALAGLSPADGFEPIRTAVLGASKQRLTILLGGNNAVTRPAAHGLGVPLEDVGLITIDAHFDMRETDKGPMNGNPIRCLLEDGLPGWNICQIGLAPWANTAKMHRDAQGAGIGIFTLAECNARGIDAVLDQALARLAKREVVMVDFDIDVVDRAQCPGAPGARPGGMPAEMFFAAARRLGSEPRVRLVDLTEFDPSLDVSDSTALLAARWVAEVLAGYSRR